MNPPPSHQALVSIIIPCYNAVDYVGEAIESALAQTHPRCEVIVIDDGSTDGSLSVIERYGERIRWKTGPNQGGGAARNRGLELATGQWVQFLDADDRLSPDKIKKQVAILAADNAADTAIAASNCQIFSGNQILGYRFSNEWQSGISGIDLLVEMWLRGPFLLTHCWLTPMKLIRQQGEWDPTLAASQDEEFFGRMLLAAKEVYFVPDEFAYYRKPGPSNVSSSKSYQTQFSRYKAWKIIQEKILALRDDDAARRAVLRHLRRNALNARKYPQILEQMHPEEKKFPFRDFDPRLPFHLRMALGWFGIKGAFTLRDWLKGKPSEIDPTERFSS